MTKSIVISSGHGKYIRGASGYLDEVDEARLVVERTAEVLRDGGVTVKTYHDDASHSQNENLNRIVNYHNGQQRELDCSIHFNAYQTTSSPMGTECLYVTQESLAKKVAGNISNASGLLNRGPKYRGDLFFLNNTTKPSVLVETAFVDSKSDYNTYNDKFEEICHTLAEALAGKSITESPEAPDGPEEPPYTPPPVEPGRPTIGMGDTGKYVESVQMTLGILPADGDFGSITDSGVKGYQAAYGLPADGIVGPKTWQALDELDAAKAPGKRMEQRHIDSIVKLANESAISRYSWRDRGVMPKGYTAGIAVCFGLAATRLINNHPTAIVAAQGDRNNPDKDVLSWYRDEFEELGMDNSSDGIDTLRGLFVLLMGLGPRESSGRYCEGRDMSADNVSADTAEASLFQTSWNISSCHSSIKPLLQDYWANPNGFLPVFQNGVSLDSSDLGNYGSGVDGAKYQFLSKYSPSFHVFVTAIGLRYLRQHWGPVNRREVELRSEADNLLLKVQHYLSANSAEVVNQKALYHPIGELVE